MVRVGTYANLRQGKQGWSRLAKVFPGMKKLPAVVTDKRSQRNGKVYYRLQIGTTSQAHSEVLCQRMKAIGQSCVVVDLQGHGRVSGMSDSRSAYDEQLPWLEAVDDEDGAGGVPARRMLAALLVVLPP